MLWSFPLEAYGYNQVHTLHHLCLPLLHALTFSNNSTFILHHRRSPLYNPNQWSFEHYRKYYFRIPAWEKYRRVLKNWHPIIQCQIYIYKLRQLTVSLPHDSNILRRHYIDQMVRVSDIPLWIREYDGYIIQEQESRIYVHILRRYHQTSWYTYQSHYF